MEKGPWSKDVPGLSRREGTTEHASRDDGSGWLTRLVRLQETGSTNDDAKRMAREGAPEGTIVVAERQTAGRGRRGRSWVAPPGTALMLSVILRPPVAPVQAPLLVFLAAAAVREAAEELLAETARESASTPPEPLLIKWPNDVVAGGRKLCGVLVETSAEPERVHWCVVGVGVNVNQRAEDFPPSLREQATSLRLLAGAPLDRDAVLERIVRGMERRYQEAVGSGLTSLVAEARRYSATLGRPVRVHQADGVHWDGVAVDIRDDGALLVRAEGAHGGVVPVYAADVSVRTATGEKTRGATDAPLAPEVV